MAVGLAGNNAREIDTRSYTRYKAVGLADGAAGATEANTCIAVGLAGRFAGETETTRYKAVKRTTWALEPSRKERGRG